MARAMVRHEDAIQTLRLDTGLVWFAQVGDGTSDTISIIPFCGVWLRNGMARKTPRCPVGLSARDKTKIPVLHQTLVTSLKNMLRMVDEGPVLHRFCSTRKLDQYETGVAVFVQDLSIRDPNGTQVFQGLLDFQGNTAWQLIGVQYRRENLQRAPVVQEILKRLDDM